MSFTWDTAMGFGYTVATGRLFCPMPDFQEAAEALLGRPVWTHEFADEAVWRELREAFERVAMECIA